MSRHSSRICLALFWLAALYAPAAAAQDFPKAPIHMLVGFPPGASTDLFARMLGLELQKAWGQAVIIDNKGGANGIIATTELAKAPPDGYKLMFTLSSHVTNALYYKKLPYDIAKDITPVTLAIRTPWLLVATPSFPANSIGELIALAKARPGEFNYGSAGEGSAPHLTTVMMASMAGISLTHVPYKGSGPALMGLLGEQISLLFATIPTVKGQLAQGKVKPLGIGSPKRVPTLPNVPTIAESGVPGFELDVWFGIIAPAGTPAPIVKKIQLEVARSLAKPEIVSVLNAQSAEPVGSTPEEFDRILKSEYAAWKKTFSEARIKTQ